MLPFPSREGSRMKGAATLLGAEGHNRLRFSDRAARGNCSRVLAAHQPEQRDNDCKEHTRHGRTLREKMERPRHCETEITEAAQGESIWDSPRSTPDPSERLMANFY